MNHMPRDQPRPKKHYAIIQQDDGLVDIYLSPDVRLYDTDIGIKEHDICVILVQGVVPWDGLEEDIRLRYDAWCDSGELIYL